jgi:chemotaxis protein methyltransferase CheR
MAALKNFNPNLYASADKGWNESAPCDLSVEQADITISDEVFLLFTDFIYKACGIKLNNHKKGLIVSRLLKRLRKLNIKDFHEYYKFLKKDSDEIGEMLNCISTNTTHFFRENHHFDYLKEKVIPEIKSFKREMRIWSAGCSTGEEPYSIAMALSEAVREQSAGDIKILATDISTKVLQKAQKGVYERHELPIDMPPERAKSFFLRGTGSNEGLVRVKDDIRGMVRFARLNFKDAEYPFRKRFDVIFCRNVMIYFDEPMKRHVVSMFHRYLEDDGYLFIGHSETMIGAKEFKPVFITVYKKA